MLYGHTRRVAKARRCEVCRRCELAPASVMWLVALTAALLLGVASDRALGAPAPTRLDDDETRSFWKGWLLLDDPALTPEEGGRKKGQITPKSVFIAPVIKDLPDCAPGYRADALGRCHRLVKIDPSAQLSFLLQKLNNMYASNDKFIKKSAQSTTEGPLQVAIPLFGFPAIKTTTPISTVSITTTETPRTEEAEIVVVAAEVEVKDDENSTSIPGAIVTLWHVNNMTNTTSNVTTPEVTEKTTTMELTTTPLIMEETTTLSPSTLQDEITTTSDISTQTIDADSTSSNTESTLSEDTTTLQSEITDSDDESSTSVTEYTSLLSTDDELNSSTITETIPSSEPKNSSSNIRSIISTTEIPLLSVHKIDSDVKIIDTSDLSSENSNEKPITFLELTDPVGLTEDDDSNISDEIGHTLPISHNQGLIPSQTWDPDTQRLRWPPHEDENKKTSPPSTQDSGWSWGPWPTTQRPVYLNFWSNVPQIPSEQHPTRTRTVIRSRPHSRYPTSFTNRPGPFYYQELSGQDVANVFRQPWQHG